MSEQIPGDEPHGATTVDGAFTLERFCARYGIGRTAAYNEINRGRLEARKQGKRTMISRAAARRWFANLPRLRPRSAQSVA
jgi:Helix-turn-helix domain